MAFKIYLRLWYYISRYQTATGIGRRVSLCAELLKKNFIYFVHKNFELFDRVINLLSKFFL